MFNLAFAFYDTVHFKVITRKVSYEIAMEEKNRVISVSYAKRPFHVPL